MTDHSQADPADSEPGEPSGRLNARLEAVKLDPLQSPLLREMLPGLPTAFDESAMRECLQNALLGTQRSGAWIERCALDQATYLPGAGCVLRYQLDVRATADGPLLPSLVTARVFPDLPTCAAYVRDRLRPLIALARGRPELAPFAAPVALIEPLRMAVSVFPIDGELPTLIGATDEQRMLDVFRETLPAALEQRFTPETCRVEMVDYGRQRRCTLRYTIEGTADGVGPFCQVVYGKITADDSGALAGPMIAALREHLAQHPEAYQFNIPRSFGWRPELQLALLEALPGEPQLGDALKARLRGTPAQPGGLRLEKLIEDCASIAAVLHTSGIGLGQRRTLGDELAALQQGTTHVQQVSPALGARLQGWLKRIAPYAASVAALGLCFCHGDFTYGQLIFDGVTSGLVDFDSICQAEPALDVGHFLVYLQIASLKAKQSRPAETNALIEQLSERFLGAYTTASDVEPEEAARLRDRVPVYRLVSLLRRVLRSWQKFKVSRIESAVDVLEEEISCLPPPKD